MSKVESILEDIKGLLTPKKEEVELEATPVEEEVAVPETVTKEEFVALCGQVEEISELLKNFLESQKKVEEPIPPPVEETVEEKVEMLSHTDAEVEMVSIPKQKFNYKLSVSERIAEAMKSM